MLQDSYYVVFFSFMIQLPPRCTLRGTLVPYATLFLFHRPARERPSTMRPTPRSVARTKASLGHSPARSSPARSHEGRNRIRGVPPARDRKSTRLNSSH